MALHVIVPYSDRPSQRPPPATVDESFYYPCGRHSLLDLVGQCALHKAQQHSLVLPWAIINGTQQPYVVGAGEVTSPLCSSLTLSIACPKVVHIAFHIGSNSARDFGLHTFPKFVL